jgi:transposase InsO family protein
MKNEPEKGGWASPKALARYDAVRFVEEAVKSGLPLCRALEAAHEREWGGRRYGMPTIEDWYYAYRHHGLAGLEDIPRKDKGHVRALAPETVEAFLTLRRAQPQVHATTLLRQLEAQGVLAPRGVSMSTLYRALAREGLDRRSLKAGSAVVGGPTKAFEFSWANQLWMSDGMWGPAVPAEPGGKPVRTHLLALIDDCSRLCTHGQYYAAERIECFLDVLRQALQARGIPEKLYTDNGSLFVSEHLRTVCANFGIRLIHAKPYAAWSKGKIERFFLTVRSDFEQRLVFAPVTDLAELNKPFGLLLVGDATLMPRLQMGVNRPLLGRLGFCLRLEPWTLGEAADYVQRRLAEVGLHENVLDPEAQELLLRIAGGIPRTINHLGQRAFEEAARERSRAIHRDHIQKALDQLPWLGRLREEE